MNLPSWVPDWSTSDDEWNGLHKPLLLEAVHVRKEDINHFHASGDTISDPEFSSDKLKLTLSAAFIDTLTYITNALIYVSDDTKYVEWLESQSDTLGRSSRYGQESFTALWKTLSGQRYRFEKDEYCLVEYPSTGHI